MKATYEFRIVAGRRDRNKERGRTDDFPVLSIRQLFSSMWPSEDEQVLFGLGGASTSEFACIVLAFLLSQDPHDLILAFGISKD